MLFKTTFLTSLWLSQLLAYCTQTYLHCEQMWHHCTEEDSSHNFAFSHLCFFNHIFLFVLFCSVFSAFSQSLGQSCAFNPWSHFSWQPTPPPCSNQHQFGIFEWCKHCSSSAGLLHQHLRIKARSSWPLHLHPPVSWTELTLSRWGL